MNFLRTEKITVFSILFSLQSRMVLNDNFFLKLHAKMQSLDPH